MKFRTEIDIPAAPRQIDPELPALLMGSCFSANIGRRMRRCRWNAAYNPGGTLFNPASIAAQLRLAQLRISHPETIDSELESSILQRGGYFASWLFDSSCAAVTADKCVTKCRNAIDVICRYLQQSRLLVLTFGTSIIYRLKGAGRGVVANCHKVAASNFDRVVLTHSEISGIYTDMVPSLLAINPDLQIVMTVSPVRHVKDGLHVNTLSKANLLIAIEEICAKFDCCRYFPAYEIVMDDLRDYRFYADDLVHPSDMAVEYIWNKFQEVWVTGEGRELLKAGERLTMRLEHRHIVAGTPDAKAFDEATTRMLAQFEKNHPGMLGCE